MENARFVGSYICKAKWGYCESSYKYIAGIANETGQSYTKAYTRKAHIFFDMPITTHIPFECFIRVLVSKSITALQGDTFTVHKARRQLLIFALNNKTRNNVTVIISSLLSIKTR